MDVKQAKAILEKIQNRPVDSAPKAGTLEGDKVFITPLANNAFEITSEDYPNPRGLKSYKYLDRIGAEMRVHPCRDRYPLSHYRVIVTWDSAVHYLIANEKLVIQET